MTVNFYTNYENSINYGQIAVITTENVLWNSPPPGSSLYRTVSCCLVIFKGDFRDVGVLQDVEVLPGFDVTHQERAICVRATAGPVQVDLEV